MPRKCLILTPFHARGMALLAEHPEIVPVVMEDLREDAIVEAIRDAHAAIVRNARITRRIIDAAPRLEVVSRHGVGYDNVDVEALTERGIPLTVTGTANSVSVAEHAMYLMLSLAKQGLAHHQAVRTGQFQVRFEMRAVDLDGKRLLIVGFGRIGSRVAPRALAFGMRVSVSDPYVDRALIEAAGCTTVDNLAQALPDVDVVTLHCPLTQETRGLIGARELALMKPSAFLVNTARGGVVDENALVAALRSGGIAGAGVDVFELEPPPADHPLLALDNVVLSPHHAGISLEASIRAAEAVVQNVLDAFAGRLSPTLVVNHQVLGGGNGPG